MSTYGDIMGSLAKKCPHGKSLDVDCAVCKKMDSIQRRKDAQLAALTAENATLQMELEAANIAAGEWEETAAELTLRLTFRQALRLTQDATQDAAQDAAAERDGLRAENERLREAHRELSRLAREVSRMYSGTSWNIGAIRKLTEYIDNKDKEQGQ